MGRARRPFRHNGHRGHRRSVNGRRGGYLRNGSRHRRRTCGRGGGGGGRCLNGRAIRRCCLGGWRCRWRRGARCYDRRARRWRCCFCWRWRRCRRGHGRGGADYGLTRGASGGDVHFHLLPGLGLSSAHGDVDVAVGCFHANRPVGVLFNDLTFHAACARDILKCIRQAHDLDCLFVAGRRQHVHAGGLRRRNRSVGHDTIIRSSDQEILKKTGKLKPGSRGFFILGQIGHHNLRDFSNILRGVGTGRAG